MTKVVFACDAGMGSSAMGATMLKKKLKEAGLTDISVEHKSFASVTANDLHIVTQEAFVAEVKKRSPNAVVYPVGNFMDKSAYDAIVEKLKG